jgi:type IV pilus assembly protein PilY1
MRRLAALVVFAGWFGSGFVATAPAFAAEEDSPECASVAFSRSSVKVMYHLALTAMGGAGAVIYTKSDDGEISAIEEPSGRLLWTWRPPELAAARVGTGLMTDLAVLRFDANNDGFIDAGNGDRVWLYFGLKRGGPSYHALDVTNRTARPLWVTGADALDGLADAWSTPAIARVRIAGAVQNGEYFVLIVGGGYNGNATDVAAGDGSADGAGPSGGADAGGSTVAKGNRVFMLDAATGQLLWSAGDRAGASRVLAQMTHAFTARVTAIDSDGDEFADRLYAADTGGRIWRFDIWNGRGRDELVTGGVFASLGAAPPLREPAAASDAREFFNAPDVALMQPRGESPWYNIAIGSGHGGNARATTVNDRFYSLRDREPFVKRAQAAYDSAQPLYDGDLTEIAAASPSVSLPGGSSGWKLSLVLNGESSGEKVLSESLTANGVVLFTTWQPAVAGGEACEANGTNRVYAVRVQDGAAALDLNEDSKVTAEDLYSTLAQDAVVGRPRIEIVRPGGRPGAADDPREPGGSDEPDDNGPPGGTRCYAGTEQLGRCVPLDTVIRTFWKRTSVN